jgi:hypothetical protein
MDVDQNSLGGPYFNEEPPPPPPAMPNLTYISLVHFQDET